MCHIVREGREVRVMRESWEGKDGVKKVVNVKYFQYFDKMLQIIRQIFGLAIDYSNSQIYLIMNYTYINLLQEIFFIQI